MRLAVSRHRRAVHNYMAHARGIAVRIIVRRLVLGRILRLRQRLLEQELQALKLPVCRVGEHAVEGSRRSGAQPDYERLRQRNELVYWVFIRSPSKRLGDPDVPRTRPQDLSAK
jgi:hypothetical protein